MSTSLGGDPGAWAGIWQVAELFGYSGLGSFTKAFSRGGGESPSVYRRKAAVRAGGGRSRGIVELLTGAERC